MSKELIYDYENKILQIKIVYYGPAMSGKTTTMKSLFRHFGKENEVESIDSTVGRTLFFDFGVLQFKGSDWNLKILVYSATGQDFYSSTRPATLNGVDGIIFVLDSQYECLKHNIRSWKELCNYFGEDFFQIPIVIAFNKSDITKSKKIDEKMFKNCIKYDKFQFIKCRKTTATSGNGILKSFKNIINSIFPDIIISVN